MNLSYGCGAIKQMTVLRLITTRRGVSCVFLFLGLLITGCAQTGVKMIRSGRTYDILNERQELLPKVPTEFTVGPGDVFRIDASFKNIKDSPFLLEREDVIAISFYYDKGQYHIMPGDGIQINFITDPELDFEALVRLDGCFTIPKIGDVVAEGNTPSDLSREIEARYKGKIHNPMATVSVTQTNLEPLVIMSGEYTILPDGKISVPMLGTFDAAGLSVDTLSQELSSAAFRYFHNNFKATVVRQNFNTQSLNRFDRVVTITPSGEVILPGVGDLRIRGLSFLMVKEKIQNSLQDIYENPVDVSLTLIASNTRSIYVSGQVKLPGLYPLAPDITTLKAIMMAGGVTTEGRLDEVVLIHYEQDGTISVFKTNLDEAIESGEGVQDLALSPQDVVYVPMSGVADANLFISHYVDRMLPFVRGINYNYNKNPDLSQR